MEEYGPVIKEAEIALSSGNYSFCIELLTPVIKIFSVSNNTGINARLMLITALSATNKNKEAIDLCKQLIKSNNKSIKDEARSLIQILNSPNLQIPENWNIQFEQNMNTNFIESKSFQDPKKLIKKENYINISDDPTGETEPFKKGFILFTLILLIFLISLLSGCVKVDNKLDLRDIDAINLEFNIKSKYINKIPWQMNFEDQIKNNFPNSEISSDNVNFTFKKKGMDLNMTKSIINKILQTTSKSLDIDFEDININKSEKNFFIGKKYFFDINLNLLGLEEFNNLEISIDFVTPSTLLALKDNQNKIIDNKIYWELIPGQNNNINFSYWVWNKLLLGSFLVLILVFFAYMIKNRRYSMGSDLPKLPS